MSDIRNVSDINNVLSKSNCLKMRKPTTNIGKTRWNSDICRKMNLHANFLWWMMIRTVNNFLTAQWLNFHQMLFKQNTFIWGYIILGSLNWFLSYARNQPNICRQNTVCSILQASLQPRNITIFSNKSKGMPACIRLETVKCKGVETPISLFEW